MVSTCRIEVERLVTVTPWRRTSSGKRAVARCTRLLTLMVAWSALVPVWKNTERLMVPEPVAVDCM
jgi:hypothetical protein